MNQPQYNLRESLLSKVYLAFGLIAGIIILGVIGFMFIEDHSFIDALFMTFITISTVGFGLVQPLSDNGKIFLMIIITLNLGIVTYAVSIVTGYFFDGEYQERKNANYIKHNIMKLNGHTIICGFGRNGRQACLVLKSQQIPFVVIEESEHYINELKENNILFVQGDATHDRSLIAANVAQAGALITTLPDDAKNLFVVLTAREMNAHMKIISRASADSSVKKLKMAGANNVIMPDKIGGSHMASLLVKPDIIEFIDYLITQDRDSIIEEIFVNDQPVLIGHAIKDLNLKFQVNIIGVKDAKNIYSISPDMSSKIARDTSLIILGKRENLKKLRADLS